MSALRAAVDQSRAGVQELVDSAYRKGVGLIVALGVVLFVAITGARVVGAWLGAWIAGQPGRGPR